LAACLCSSVTLIVLGFLPKLPQKAPSAPRWQKTIYTTIFYFLAVMLFAADVVFLGLLRYDNWWGKDIDQRNELAFRDMGEKRIRVYDGKKCGAIDIWGKTVIKCRYQFIGDFSEEGLAHVKSYDKFGFIDRRGKIIIPSEFADAEPFNAASSLARVKLFGSDEWAFIDKVGNLLVPLTEKHPALPDELSDEEQPTDEVQSGDEEQPVDEEQPALPDTLSDEEQPVEEEQSTE
jgi:hypothetical protein